MNGLAKAYLAGVLHGDGWCTRLTLGLRAKDQDFVQAFCQAVNDVFDMDLAPRLDDRGYWLVRTSNKTGKFDWLRDYNPRDNREVGRWLRGLFDSEGNAQLVKRPSLGPNSYQRRVAMYSTNLMTLQQGLHYLIHLGISAKIRTTKKLVIP